MRPSARSTFHGRQPLKAGWERPHVDRVDLSQDEIDGITGAADPQAELRKVYLQKKVETADK